MLNSLLVFELLRFLLFKLLYNLNNLFRTNFLVICYATTVKQLSVFYLRSTISCVAVMTLVTILVATHS